MNSQQAINLLKGLEQSLDDYCGLNDKGKAVFRMAITALELFGISEQLPSVQSEPCEDAVSRKDVQSIAERSDWFESSDSFNDFMWALYALPSVTPKI